MHYEVWVSSFSNLIFFSIGSSHSQGDTRLYPVSHPLFLISWSMWHVSLYPFCCLLVRYFKHVCPCQWHLWNWYTVLVSGSYPSTKKDTDSFLPLSFKIETFTMRYPPCPHILWWMCLPVCVSHFVVNIHIVVSRSALKINKFCRPHIPFFQLVIPIVFTR